MEVVRFENFSFSYPNAEKTAVTDVSLSINKGDFAILCGRSGSGKTTLLKLIKSELSPHGKPVGNVSVFGKSKDELSIDDRVKIGFVMQNPDRQIVTDTVWHELSFGLENLGMPQGSMRLRIAEVASFFGIEKWFSKKTSDLSGGQKQILNLASVMVMEPELLILDEPTSQLDPISAGEFFRVLSRINGELGTTVILSEHRTEEIFPYAKRVIVMEEGRIISDSTPSSTARILKEKASEMFLSMPAVMQIYESVCENGECPVSVSGARVWLDDYIKNHPLPTAVYFEDNKHTEEGIAVSVKDIRYKYEKKSEYILKGLSLDVRKGEIYGILGGNGTGKSTLMWLMAGGLKLQNGKIRLSGKTAMLPQNPEVLFSKNTVAEELMSTDVKKAEELMRFCRIEHLKNRHPYDLSGGEQQKLALSKVLLQNPEIVLLDEPTKGFDAHFKGELDKILKKLKEQGITVIMVSHDIEFCARSCDRCGLLFDGTIVSSDSPRSFFGGKKFYTTQTARLFKGYAENIISVADAVSVLEEEK